MRGNIIKHDKPFEYLTFAKDKHQQIIEKTNDNNNIRLMTYNVHGFRDAANKPKYEKILETISKINPDIFVLEEVKLYGYRDVCTMQQLRADLFRLGYRYQMFSKNNTNAILSKYQFVGRELELQRDPVHGAPRNALICNFDFTINDETKHLLFVGCHLDVYDETGATRVKQIEKIIDNIKSYAKQNQIDYEDMNIIISGDFNSLRRSDYNEAEWNYYIKKDAQRNVVTVQDVVPILKANKYIDSFESCNKAIKTSVWSGRRVDYIYGKNIHFVNTSEYKTIISDHYPIYADIVLNLI